MSLKISENGSLSNKSAIVTGGTRGIGRAIAEKLLDEGARVAICGASRKSVDDALARLSSRGETFGMVADISKLDQAQAFVAAVDRQFHGVDILINNAGVGVFRAVADLAPADWERMIALNLSGVYYCCHAVLPIFKQRKGGDIINVGSLAGRNPFAGGAGYNASKFGLNGFSEAMMLDHRNDGVRVSQVMPGSVATEFGGSAHDRKAEAGADWKIAPQDIAEVVVTLLRMPRRTTVSRVEIRPSRPPGKA
ncbi:MAG: SDR family oxidoreductase [Bryobacteraceae bacterium]|jgi:NADP-dependent 3-hydroxy acid dehydrogenase YdfG